MLPTSAVSGFYFAHRDSQYFGVARIGRDQLEDYAMRRGIDLDTATRWLRPEPRLKGPGSPSARHAAARLPPADAALFAAPGAAQPARVNAIQPELVAEGPREAGRRGRAGDRHAHQRAGTAIG